MVRLNDTTLLNKSSQSSEVSFAMWKHAVSIYLPQDISEHTLVYLKLGRPVLDLPTPEVKLT